MKSVVQSAALLCAMSTFALAAPPSESPQSAPAALSAAPSVAEMPGEKMKCAVEDMAGNQFEIQAGQLGQERGGNPQVKELGMHLTQDHQKAQQALQEAFKDASATTAELNAVQQAKLQELQKKQGEEFDRCFVFGMVADHEHDLLAYRWQADHAPDTNVQKYAKSQIPVLEAHLKMARAASKAFLGEPGQAGGHVRGTNSMNNAASAGHDSHNFSSQPNKEGAGAPGGTGTDRTTHR